MDHVLICTQLLVGSMSAIDLSICSPTVFMDSQWKVHEDQCGVSDHFPIFIKTKCPKMATEQSKMACIHRTLPIINKQSNT